MLKVVSMGFLNIILLHFVLSLRCVCTEGVCLCDSSRTLILLHFVLSLEVCVY